MVAIDPITQGIQALQELLKRLWPTPLTKEDEEKIGAEIEKTFREFVILYEGAAKDVPRFLVVFRGLIRPCFTCLVGYLDYLFFTSQIPWEGEHAALLKAINLIVLFFWFGERAVRNSGIIDLLVGKK